MEVEVEVSFQIYSERGGPPSIINVTSLSTTLKYKWIYNMIKVLNKLTWLDMPETQYVI